MTSEDLAGCLQSHPVVIRRVLGALKNAGILHSEKGHGGGWTIAADTAKITLFDIYQALGEEILPEVERTPDGCRLVQALESEMDDFFTEAKSLLEAKLRRVTVKKLIQKASA